MGVSAGDYEPPVSSPRYEPPAPIGRHTRIWVLVVCALLPSEEFSSYTRGVLALQAKFFAEKTVPTAEEFGGDVRELLDELRDEAYDDLGRPNDRFERCLKSARFLKEACARARTELAPSDDAY